MEIKRAPKRQDVHDTRASSGLLSDASRAEPCMSAGSGGTSCAIRWRPASRPRPPRVPLPDFCHARSAPCWSSGANVDVLRPLSAVDYFDHKRIRITFATRLNYHGRVTRHRLVVASSPVASRAKRSASDGGGRTPHTMRDSTALSTTPIPTEMTEPSTTTAISFSRRDDLPTCKFGAPTH
jgi:hypothetical protein